MSLEVLGPPVVDVPERVDRHLRLGPFPSARDALKFLGYAATGAVLASVLPPFVWIPIPLVGFVASVARVDGDAPDELALRWALFHVGLRGRGGVKRQRAPARLRGAAGRLEDGRFVAAVSARGVPLAYRPPADLNVLFERFKELLRGTAGPLLVRATTTPLRPPSLGRSPEGLGPAEGTAREGYVELARALCNRRSARKVDVLLTTANGSADLLPRLREQSRALSEAVRAMDLPATVLEGPALTAAVLGVGWTLSSEVP